MGIHFSQMMHFRSAIISAASVLVFVQEANMEGEGRIFLSLTRLYFVFVDRPSRDRSELCW